MDIYIYIFSRTRKQGIILLLADEPLMIPFEVGVSTLAAKEEGRALRVFRRSTVTLDFSPSAERDYHEPLEYRVAGAATLTASRTVIISSYLAARTTFPLSRASLNN